MTHTKDEALKLALMGAANYIDALGGDSRKYRQALANAALDRKAENARELGLDYEPAPVQPVKPSLWEQYHAAQPAPVQEPVAFFHPNQGFYWARPTKITAPATVDVEPLPLYTTPPAAQRQWVGLTDDEIEKLRESFATRYAIEAIEAKLKEKNT